MAELIGGVVALIIVCGIPWYLGKKKEKEEADRIADEFMKFHFGDDYKDKYK